MQNLSPPRYYMMDTEHDLFSWFGTLPPPQIPADITVQAVAIWATGLRYALRCLYKETATYEMGQDALKAATCFIRLGELLKGASQA